MRTVFATAVVVVAAVAAGGTAGAVGRPSAGTPEIPQKLPAGFLVLPFENDSKVKSLEWMRVGLPVALAEKLESHPGFALVSPTEEIVPEGAMPDFIDEEVVVAAAEKARARFVWTGTFRRPDWKLEFFVRLWRVEGGSAMVIGEAREHGDFSEVFALLDDAILDLCARAGRPVPDAARPRLTRVPTKDFYAYTLYGRGLLKLSGLTGPSDVKRAEKDLGRSVFIDPKFAEAHRMLAVVHGRLGERGKARGQLSYALDLRDDYYAPLKMLLREAFAGRVSARPPAPTAGSEAWLASLAPMTLVSVQGKGAPASASSIAAQREEGIELALRALAQRPWDLEVRYILGELLWEDGDIEGARRELKRLTKVDPDHLPARRVLVLVHAAQGNMADLASELEEILKLDPDDERARLDLGAAYHALGDDSRARGIYEGIVVRNPRHLQALKFLGDIARASGDVEAAISYYEKALQANRNDPRPYFLLGSTYLSAGDDDNALRIYHAAQRFPRYVAEVYSNLGAIHYRRGDNAEALWYLRTAAQRRPQNPRIHYNYGLALSRAHVRDQALEEMTRAAELDPSEADFQFGLGVALLRVGRLEEAERAFQAALRLDPDHADARHNLTLIDELRRRATEGEIQVE